VLCCFLALRPAEAFGSYSVDCEGRASAKIVLGKT